MTAPPPNSTAARMSALITRQRVVARQNRRRAAHNRMVLASTVRHGTVGLAAGSARVTAGGDAEHRGPGGRAARDSSAGRPVPGPGRGLSAAASCQSSLSSWRAWAIAFRMTARSRSDKITVSCATIALDSRRGGRTRERQAAGPGFWGACASAVRRSCAARRAVPGTGRAWLGFRLRARVVPAARYVVARVSPHRPRSRCDVDLGFYDPDETAEHTLIKGFNRNDEMFTKEIHTDVSERSSDS